MAENETPEPIDVYALVMTMVDNMSSIAWCKLGLQHDPLTNRIEKDLTQAKVAIDLTTHLASVIESQLDEDDKRRVNTLVRDLRLNYVEKMKENS